MSRDAVKTRESFEQRAPGYVERVEGVLEAQLPSSRTAPVRLHEAMRYAALGAGKRMRPLLCYATAEALGVELAAVDDAACAVELIHAFSLVHDDLPAMDDDALRRGRPTTHKAFGDATAILVGDALQTRAFGVLSAPGRGSAERRLRMLHALAEATGSTGMTGGQQMDLAAEDQQLSLADLETLHQHKTGCLIRVAVHMAWLAGESLDDDMGERLDRFAANVGLAFQIRDDLLDVEGDTAIIGKTHGADAAHSKSTYPSLLGTDAAKRRVETLYDEALDALEPLGADAEPLRWMAGYIVHRNR